MKKIGLLIFVIVFACSNKMNAQTVMTIAGNGLPGFSGDTAAAIDAELYGPYGVALDGLGNIYIIDQLNQRIRKIDASGIIITIAGTGTAGYSGDSGLAMNAQINLPRGIAADDSGNVYIADYGNNCIRKVDNMGYITTIAGTGHPGYTGDNGPAVAAKLNSPSGVAVDNKGNIFIADRSNQVVRKVNSAGIITTFAGNGIYGYNGDNWPSALLASFEFPTALAVDKMGNVYIADQFNERIRMVDTSGYISTVWGDGNIGFSPDNDPATLSWMCEPDGVALDSIGDIYVSDECDHRIRKLEAGAGAVITIAGNGISGYNGDSASALLTEIGDCKGIASDPSGIVYFADWNNNRVNAITSTLYSPSLQQSISGVRIYPNPTQGNFTINITSNSNQQAKLVISNVLGETVKIATVATNKDQQVSLNAATGIYFISATTPDSKWNGKLEVATQ